MHYTKLLLSLTFITYSYSFSINTFTFNLNRRELLQISGVSLIPSFSSPSKPICVIGANGETGRECIKLLAENKTRIRAVSRKPINFKDLGLDTGFEKYIESMQIDIKEKTNINDIIKGTSSVIFLANAKKKYRYFKNDAEQFQNYEDIDILALKNIAESCISNNIPRLVYVSGSCKSCAADPTSQIDKICGIECDNCRSKQSGENIIRDLYKDVNHIDYTIVRIGYLINGENRGAKEIEINQDFTKSGMISRTDLANICINSIYNKQTARTTFEAYYRDTTQPYDVRDSLQMCTNMGKSIEECFFGSEYKDKKPESMEEVRKKPIKGSLFTTGHEFQGENWNDLFQDIKKDNNNPFLIDDKNNEKTLDENDNLEDIMPIQTI